MTGRILVTTLFVLLCLNAWVQVILALAGQNTDSPLLRSWQFLSGAAAAAAAVGAWRLRRWAPLAAWAYAVITAAMIVSLGPMLGLDPAERQGLWPGALAVLVTCGAVALYLRRLVRRSVTGAR